MRRQRFQNKVATGRFILPTLDEAKRELKEMLGGMFGDASATVVIEEFLSGIECSVRKYAPASSSPP